MTSSNLPANDQCVNCPARSLSPFAHASEQTLREIDRSRTLITFTRDSLLPLDLNRQIGFYCIRSGHIKLNYTDQQTQEGTVRICGTGDLVGYGSTPESHIISALEDCVACYFPHSSFFLLMERSLEICKGIIDSLCRTILLKDRRIVALESYSVKSRIAGLLLSLNGKFGSPTPYGSKINVRIDRGTLAKLAGTKCETLSRMLTQFEEQKIIRRHRRDIYVLDEVSLRKLTGP